MTPAQLRQAIGEALTAVPFTPPLSLDYCAKAMAALHARLPGVVLEVNDVGGKHTTLRVEARDGAVRDVVEVRVG